MYGVRALRAISAVFLVSLAASGCGGPSSLPDKSVLGDEKTRGQNIPVVTSGMLTKVALGGEAQVAKKEVSATGSGAASSTQYKLKKSITGGAYLRRTDSTSGTYQFRAGPH